MSSDAIDVINHWYWHWQLGIASSLHGMTDTQNFMYLVPTNRLAAAPSPAPMKKKKRLNLSRDALRVLPRQQKPDIVVDILNGNNALNTTPHNFTTTADCCYFIYGIKQPSPCLL